jgi:hypothetical protein
VQLILQLYNLIAPPILSDLDSQNKNIEFDKVRVLCEMAMAPPPSTVSILLFPTIQPENTQQIIVIL